MVWISLTRARNSAVPGLAGVDLAVEAIVADICDRRGIKHAWLEIDLDVQDEIREPHGRVEGWTALCLSRRHCREPHGRVESWDKRMTLFQIDTIRFQHLNRRVEQLKGYLGTADELPGDNARLSHARKRATDHMMSMILFQFDQAHDRVAADCSKSWAV